MKIYKKLIYIIGPPRSGNTVTMDILNVLDNVISHDEDNPNYPISEQIMQELYEDNYVVHKVPAECLGLPELYILQDNSKFILLHKNKKDLIKSYENYAKKWKVTNLSVRDKKDRIFEPDKIYDAYIKVFNEYKDKPNCMAIDIRDIEDNGLETFKKVFKFLDLPFTEEVQEFIKKYVKKYPLLGKDYPGKAGSAKHIGLEEE